MSWTLFDPAKLPDLGRSDELILMLALIGTLLPLQLALGWRLHRQATGGTPLWICIGLVSSAKHIAPHPAETAGFRVLVARYQRAYVIALTPIFLVIFPAYVWLKMQ